MQAEHSSQGEERIRGGSISKLRLRRRDGEKVPAIRMFCLTLSGQSTPRLRINAQGSTREVYRDNACDNVCRSEAQEAFALEASRARAEQIFSFQIDYNTQRWVSCLKLDSVRRWLKESPAAIASLW